MLIALLLAAATASAGGGDGRGRGFGSGAILTVEPPAVAGPRRELILFGGVAAPFRPDLGLQIFRADPFTPRCHRIRTFRRGWSIQLTRDGRYAVVALHPGRLGIVDLRRRRTRLLNLPRGVLSTDGRLLAYADRGRVLVARRDGGGRRIVAATRGRSVSYGGFAWSPDDRWLAFSVSTGDWPELKTSLEVLNLRTRARRTLYREPDPYGHAPVATWSPDGLTLYVAGTENPFTITRDGRRRRRLEHPGQGSPIWSPDGRRMLFTDSGAWGVGDVFVANADGTDVRRLTNTKPPEIGEEQRGSYALAWSPDGGRILYLRHFTLAIMRPDGSAKRDLCRPPRGTQDAVVWTMRSAP